MAVRRRSGVGSEHTHTNAMHLWKLLDLAAHPGAGCDLGVAASLAARRRTGSRRYTSPMQPVSAIAAARSQIVACAGTGCTYALERLARINAPATAAVAPAP